MTEHTLPRVTVIVVTTPDDEGPDGPMAHHVHSVEKQDYPRELVDTNIVRNVEGHLPEMMRIFGAMRADTDWIAFMSVQQVWPPDLLRRLVNLALEDDSHGASAAGATLVRREVYLDNAEEFVL